MLLDQVIQGMIVVASNVPLSLAMQEGEEEAVGSRDGRQRANESLVLSLVPHLLRILPWI